MGAHTNSALIETEHSALAQAVGGNHLRYTRAINLRERWAGFLWQGAVRAHLGGQARSSPDRLPLAVRLDAEMSGFFDIDVSSFLVSSFSPQGVGQ
ncbi:MAG: hypothetical protein QE280_09910 [Caulobacter sp.]|nr:hypothetical protein [Caulobacter sp.]